MDFRFWIFDWRAGIAIALGVALLQGAAVWAAAPITAAAFAGDGKTVVVGSQAGIEVHSWPELAPVRRLETRLENVHDLKFSSAGTVLAVVGGSPGEAGEVELIEWPGGRPVAHAAPHADLVYSVDWRPDGKSLVTASGDRSAAILSAETGEVERRLSGHSRGVLAAAWLPDGLSLVTAGSDQTLRVWAAEGQVLRTLDNHTGTVAGLAVRPGTPTGARPMLASIGGDRTLRFWQPTIGRLVRFARLESEPLAVAWTADGALAVIACTDGRVRAFDPDTAEEVADVEAVQGWAYTLLAAPEGRELLVGGAEGEVVRIVLP